MNEPARKLATYNDVVAAPEHCVAELVNGSLYVQSRPAMLHAVAATALGEELGPPFKRGRGGPGGWIILFEPELHLGSDVMVPDLAGWRRETMPEVPLAAFVSQAPDWVCEVLSPSTAQLDRVLKLPIYGRENVSFVWIVDPGSQVVEALQLRDGLYSILGSYAGEDRARIQPFDAIELDLSILWQR